MLVQDRISIPDEALAELCRRYYVRELALFGSVLRDDFRDDSDIDVLVEFEPDAPIGFIALQRLRRELAELFGRPVDLVSKNGLNRHFRVPILASAQVVFER
jgi:predicted nucleotidyltransferase